MTQRFKMDSSNTKPLSYDLHEEIMTDILTGRLADGSKLTEQFVCKTYKVSRTPVREALIRLSTEGLLKNIPNRGVFVCGLSQRDISDIFELRSLAEVQTAEWAVMRMPTESIDKLSEVFEMMEFYTLSGEAGKVMEFNSEFHDIICRGAQNRMIEAALLRYRKYLRHTLPEVDYSAKLLKEILKEHRAIFDAFEAKNSAAGRNAMEEHMNKTRERRLRSY